MSDLAEERLSYLRAPRVVPFKRRLTPLGRFPLWLDDPEGSATEILGLVKVLFLLELRGGSVFGTLGGLLFGHRIFSLADRLPTEGGF